MSLVSSPSLCITFPRAASWKTRRVSSLSRAVVVSPALAHCLLALAVFFSSAIDAFSAAAAHNSLSALHSSVSSFLSFFGPGPQRGHLKIIRARVLFLLQTTSPTWGCFVWRSSSSQRRPALWLRDTALAASQTSKRAHNNKTELSMASMALFYLFLSLGSTFCCCSQAFPLDTAHPQQKVNN